MNHLAKDFKILPIILEILQLKIMFLKVDCKVKDNLN